MKTLIRLFVCAALLATLGLVALAQTPASSSTTAAAPTQDEAEAKTALYGKFRDNYKTNPPVAYEAGKEYLEKYEAKDGPDDQYVKFIKKYVVAYDKQLRRNQFDEAIKAKSYDKAFETGRAILAEEPEDLVVLYRLSGAGYAAAEAGNKANSAATINYTRKALELVEAGRTFEKDKPIPNKNEIIGGLNYVLGYLSAESQPTEAVGYLIKAAGVDGFAKKDPRTYLFLASAYEKGDYAKLATQYKNTCTATPEAAQTPDCVALKAKTDQMVDLIIDALARAIAYNDISPNAAANTAARAAWMEQLTGYYKYRHEGNDTGLKELIAGIMTKPIPKASDMPVTTPSTTTGPATQPNTTTPASTSTTTTTQPATNTAKPNTTTPATTTTQPTVKKTTPKRAHARSKRG